MNLQTGQDIEVGRDRIVQGFCSQAASDHKQTRRPAGGESGVAFAPAGGGKGRNVRPNRVARQPAFFGRENSGRVGQGQKNTLGEAPGQAVGQARHAVLLVQGDGHMSQTRGAHPGKGRIPAEADDKLRPEFSDNPAGGANGLGHAEPGGKTAQAPADHAAHGQADEVQTRGHGQIRFRPLPAAHEQEHGPGEAPADFLGHGQGRKNMPACAACGDDDAFHAYAFAVRE